MSDHKPCNKDAVSISDIDSDFDTFAGDFPQPSPFPQPGPQPIPPDWWKCIRIGPVSGRYYGAMTAPGPGQYELDLRVDIDLRHKNSPVMNCISGDVYKVNQLQWGNIKKTWRVYIESGIVNNPTVKWSKCAVGITGNVSYWKGTHLVTNIQVVIPWRDGAIGPAEVKLSNLGGVTSYKCDKKSNAFREVTLEVDVCRSVNRPPLLPSYDTHSHPGRPVDLPQRTLTIEEAYDEAGTAMTISPSHTNIIDDSDPKFNTWSPAELHDAMELHFSQYPGTWPKWNVWCLMAGTFDDPNVGGIMFDAAATYGGAGKAPDRQGCAVFRNHSWFNNLVPPPAGNDTQAEAMRKFLYTYVHEIGHAFNFLHSWNKSRPDALSWMNYDWKYDARNGAGSFWGNFRMRFDDEELIHMRHGDRVAVIMGGDPWASGGHMESQTGAMSDQVETAPIELLIRSKGYYHFMEPVVIELRLKNTSDLPIELDTQLNPEYGGVIIYIRRSDGRIFEYAPVLCKQAIPDLKILKPNQEALTGMDRYSQNVFLSYGSYGYYFDEPGDYLIRAVYQGAGDVLITSPLHRVRIGSPFSQDDERIAQDFFTYEAGMSLYLNGSDSPFLKKGMDTLEVIADRYRENPVGANVSLILAQNLARPFFRIENGKLIEARVANPSEALSLTTRALEQYKQDESVFTNITYHQLRRTRADLMVAMDAKDEAKEELKTLVQDLKNRNVKQRILEEIQAYAKSI